MIARTLGLGLGQLAPGDTIGYAITLPSGEVRRPVVTYLSKTEQRDSNGALVTRTASGSRLRNKDWHYRPHDGEFPDTGRLQMDAAWSFEIEAWQDPTRRLRHVRHCEVTDRSSFRTREYAFDGAWKVDCRWTMPDGAEFRTSTSWYWRDDAGYYLMVDSIQRDVVRGTLSVDIERIDSAAFPPD